MVRAAGLYGQMRAGVGAVSADGLTPAQQLSEINKFALSLVADKQACWQALRAELAGAGVYILEQEELSEADREWLDRYFMTHVFPILTPINVDPAHPFPFIQNKGLTLALEMSGPDDKAMNGLIPIPGRLERFIRLPAAEDASRIRFVRIETVVSLFLAELYPTFEIHAQGTFRVLRDSDVELQEEAEDLTRAYESQLKRRRRGHVIRLEIGTDMPDRLQQFVIDELAVANESVFRKQGLLGLSDTSQLIVADRPELLFKPFNIRFPERIREFNGDVFAAIRAKDLVVHHPYESFDVVLQYLRQAVADPEVVAIKWTLYRTSGQKSPIVAALKEAAEEGKSVTAVVELKARFDETTKCRSSTVSSSSRPTPSSGSWFGARAPTSPPTATLAPATTTRRRRASTLISRSSPPTR
jgi:polyphosphate kinase